jgi:renal tumor antigen
MLTSSACADRACRYRLIGKKGEGTFSEVLKAQGIKNGKYVAIKCMKNHFDSLDQVNNLREIQALRRLSPHPGVIKLCEVLYDQPTRRLALVFELMDMNIYELIRGRRQYLAETRIKIYMYQLLKSMDHMHRNGIFHRDIKVCARAAHARTHARTSHARVHSASNLPLPTAPPTAHCCRSFPTADAPSPLLTLRPCAPASCACASPRTSSSPMTS